MYWKWHVDKGYMTKTAIFLKSKMADGRHFENLEYRFFDHNSSTDFPISAKFCTKKHNGMSTRATWQKLQIFKTKMADGRHLENR